MSDTNVTPAAPRAAAFDPDDTTSPSDFMTQVGATVTANLQAVTDAIASRRAYRDRMNAEIKLLLVQQQALTTMANAWNKRNDVTPPTDPTTDA
jgi:hypothetical protein